MSIVKIADEAEALSKIWDSLTGCSIAWEIQNTNLPTCTMVTCAQITGTRKGSWDNIPTGECEECGTQHDGIFSSNYGGVVYYVPGQPDTPNVQGIYFGIFWSDPLSGPSHFGYCTGWGDAAGKAYVVSQIQKSWGNAGSIPISGKPSFPIVQNGVEVNIQPGFDPFKITFSIASSGDNVDRVHSAAHYLDTPETLKEKYRAQGNALLEHAEKIGN